MEVKDKIEMLFKLAEQKWNEYNERRSYEWKINFSLWSGIGIITAFCINEINFSKDYIWLLIGVYVIVFIVYVIFRKGLSNSCANDQIERFKYINKIHELLDINESRKPHQWKFLGLNWSHFTQIFITLIVLTASVIVVSMMEKS